jgi:cell division protein FtsL
LRLVPELQSGKKANDKSFIIITSSVFIAGLFLLLLINTALAQDAFKLQQLKAQATTLADQREAILKEVSEKSSPAKLAENAMKLGMIVNTNPRFLDLTGGGLKP